MSKIESSLSQNNLLAERRVEVDQNHFVEMVVLAEVIVFQEIATGATPTGEIDAKKASVEVSVKRLDLVENILRQEKLIVNRSSSFSSAFNLFVRLHAPYIGFYQFILDFGYLYNINN